MPLTPTQELLSAIERDRGGIAIVRCPDLGLRDWLIDETRGLAGLGAKPVIVRSVAEALAVPDQLALLVPSDERELMDDLEGCRDLFLAPARSQPVVVFLIRDGDGARRLPFLPSLASWVRGSDVDPEKLAEIDVVAERERFEAEAGESVEAWLERWRAGRIEQTGQQSARAYWAAMLEVADARR